MFFSLPVQLICAMIAALVVGPFLSAYTIASFYTVSIVFKECLTFLLPFMVFFFVSHGILALNKRAPAILGVLLLLVFCSNACFAFIAYFVGITILPSFMHSVDVACFSPIVAVESLFNFSLRPLIASEKALVLALASGLSLLFFPVALFTSAIRTGKAIIETILIRVIIPLLPLYVFGFLLKIQAEGMLLSLIQYYGGAVFLIIGLQWSALLLLYVIANLGSVKGMMQSMMNALPSYITAFSTMSSTATVPVSIAAAEKNIHHKPLAGVAMPIMANVHVLGDAIGIPLLTLVTLQLFIGSLPGLQTYGFFAGYFCTSMFAVSGVPGGAIIVIIPILSSLFHFNPEMIGVITTLYILMDPFGTASNVMGDGALVIIVDRVINRLGIVRD